MMRYQRRAFEAGALDDGDLCLEELARDRQYAFGRYAQQGRVCFRQVTYMCRGRKALLPTSKPPEGGRALRDAGKRELVGVQQGFGACST